MNNIPFLLFASVFLPLLLMSASTVSYLFAQQNDTSSNMTSMQQQNETGVGTASQLENMTGDNSLMMQNNSEISNSSLSDGLQAEQNTTDIATNQTGETGQAAMNQTGEAGQTVMNQTGEALSNASKLDVAQNISQGGQEIGQTVANETGDIFGSISEGLKGLFGMK
jgi:hypothetical protein